MTFNVTNTGVAEHDFTIQGLADQGLTGTQTIAAGQTTSLEVDALDVGDGGCS